MLSKFQNNIRVIETRMLTFCHSKIPDTWDGFDTYNAFVAASSNYVKAKQEIEIYAAVGAFSRAAMPEIIIADKSVPLEADGVAHYKFKAPEKTGKHIVHVKISFTDVGGRRQTVFKDIEYTVAQ
jgi:hypothetical protein